jgi:hypothetical protein
MPEENFSPEQSLRLIQAMIDKTKQDISGKAHYFLVWGWITFIACVGQFILKHVVHYEKHYLVWLLVFVGIAYSVYMRIKEGRSKRVKTHVGESMGYLWAGMGITYLVTSIVLTKIGWETSVFPFFIILYALGTFVSGCILRFRPLVIGGLLAWVLAIVAVFLPYDYQMLAAAGAILVSYIIPAYMLPKKRIA